MRDIIHGRTRGESDDGRPKRSQQRIGFETLDEKHKGNTIAGAHFHT